MHTIYLMRHSFVGRSDWRASERREPSIMLSEERLEKRFKLLEDVSVRSMADQTDPEFDLILIGAAAAPRKHKKKVKELFKDMLGDRGHVLFKPPQSVSIPLTRFRRNSLMREEYCNQVILDDDDAVASWFTDRIKKEAKAALSLFVKDQTYSFISHAKGFALVYEADGTHTLRTRNIGSTALGLTLLSKADERRSPFKIAHKKIINRRPVRVVYGGPPMYIRGVHDDNNSKAVTGGDIVDPEKIQALMADGFPLLKPFFEKELQAQAT
ncbi:MAG: glycosyltransferase [Sulfitobacter sp.]